MKKLHPLTRLKQTLKMNFYDPVVKKSKMKQWEGSFDHLVGMKQKQEMN